MTTETAQSGIYPALFYQDASAAMAWLGEAFGFEQRLVVRGSSGEIMHAELSCGAGVIMLGTADTARGMRSPRELGGINQSIYLCIDNPDAHYDRARAAGAEIVRELENTEYGSRGYTARDPEGHTWSFGTYRPGA